MCCYPSCLCMLCKGKKIFGWTTEAWFIEKDIPEPKWMTTQRRMGAVLHNSHRFAHNFSSVRDFRWSLLYFSNTRMFLLFWVHQALQPCFPACHSGFFLLPSSHFLSFFSHFCHTNTTFSVPSVALLLLIPFPDPQFFKRSSKALIKIYSTGLIYSSHNHLFASKDCRLLLFELAGTADFHERMWWHLYT